MKISYLTQTLKCCLCRPFGLMVLNCDRCFSVGIFPCHLSKGARKNVTSFSLCCAENVKVTS